MIFNMNNIWPVIAITKIVALRIRKVENVEVSGLTNSDELENIYMGIARLVNDVVITW